MKRTGVKAWLANLAPTALIYGLKVFPYRWRVPMIGWITARIIAPLSGHERRALDNLALTCPDLPPAEARRIARAASDNAGRTMAELFSLDPFLKHAARARVTGPGLGAMEEARRAGRPIITISGHFGNYHVVRVVLDRAGHSVGALYRPMGNPSFNKFYSRHMEAISSPNFVQSRRGMAGMIRHLRAGNLLALLIDQRDQRGAELSFFGKPALTPVSAAEMALKYNALLVPFYVTRKADGLEFDLHFSAPIAHSDPETMTQSFLDELEERVRADMGQWLWIHRRWRIPAHRKPLA
ncbi:MAG TPA: lauroyl acyltransferase [Aliiroseovarius sp.]|nr:lauroyl acyltransferase [Aliiroseovarius sp.]